MLSLLRAGVLVLDPVGTVVKATGGLEGILGFEIDELVGRNAIEFVAPRDQDQIAFMFLADPDHVRRRVSPPFSIHLLDRSGQVQRVECLATGVPTDEGFWWVVTLTPRDLQPLSYHALDRYLAGAGATDVAAAAVDRLSTISPEGVRIEGFVIHHRVDGVLTQVAGGAPSPLRGVLQSCVRDRSAPWNQPQRAGPPSPLDVLPRPVAVSARGAGFCITDLRIAAADGANEVAMVLFANHPTAFHGNVSLILDHAVEIVAMALTRTRAEEVLRRAAEQDPLTGLANRSRFSDLLEGVGDEDAGGVGAAVLFIDLDRFKAINDRHGHAVGDAVLVEVAERIRSACRPDDDVARLGGDEFAVRLRDVDEAAARVVGDRVRETIAGPLPTGLGPTAITATVGLATAATADGDLVGAADLAMLEGKRTGRGRLTSAAPVVAPAPPGPLTPSGA